MMYLYEVEGNFRIEFGVQTQGTKKLNQLKGDVSVVLTIVIVIVKSCWVGVLLTTHS